MSGIFEKMYLPYFVWEHGDRVQSCGATDSMSPEQTPSLLLSDSDDDVSAAELTPRQTRPLHELEEPQEELEEGRHVRFSAAKIREHSVIVGDHPACCDLLPLSLDWAYGEEKVYDIDDYEVMRESSGRTARGRLPKLGLAERRRILENCCSTAQSLSEDPAPVRYDLDPVMVQDLDQFEYFDDIPVERLSTCNPFEVFQRTGWEMFGDDVCGLGKDYPTMTVEILED